MIEMNTPIWRYLSFFKFFDWVASRKMYFARADQFKDDRWECVIPDVILLKRLELLKESGFDAERIHRIRNQYDVTNPLRRSHSFVSSWFRAELFHQRGKFAEVFFQIRHCVILRVLQNFLRVSDKWLALPALT